MERSTKKPRLCMQCGTEFRPVLNSKSQAYCSRKCVDRSLETSGFTHQCVECGTEFVTRMTRSKFCSMKCSSAAQKRRPAQRFIARCEWCGSHFIGRSAKAKLCCTAHRLAKSRYARGLIEQGPQPSNVIYLTAAVFDEWFKKAA